MAIPLALPAAATVGRLAMQALPFLTAAGAAAPALREGKPLEAAIQGGLGYATGGLLGGGVRAAQGTLGRAAGKLAPKLAGATGIAAITPQAIGKLSQAGLPLAAAALAPKIGGVLAGPSGSNIGQAVSGGLGGAAQLGAGVIGYTADGAPVYGNIGGAAIPPGMGQYGPTSPYGGPLDVLGPAGMGQRLQTLKDAQTQRDVFRTLMPEVMGVREATAKKDFERNMAAAGIRQNIDTRARMQMAAQQAGLRAGLGAMDQAGAALTRQYQYQ